MSVDYQLIGRRISQYRRAERKTQENLAEGLGVSVGYISQIERGVTKVSLDTLSNIAQLLDCDMTELLDGTAYGRRDYMNDELKQLESGLTDRQKKLLYEVMQAIRKYS